ncbi:unnamed protein product [Adineta steineri]|uniref:Uncharacterized protein n=1 Tax=Adineta steineri TaxID=433720 RepID=A0A815IM70_9BILA|nr:unnamed protein product [Adineta steineri]
MFEINKYFENLILIFLLLTNTSTTNNLLRNGDFSQLHLHGQPTNWNIHLGQGNNSIKILPKKYLSFNVLQISVYTNQILVTLTQTIQLEQNTNKTLLLISFWYKTWISFSSGSIRLEFYDKLNKKISNEYLKSLSSNLTWTSIQIKKSLSTNAISAKFIIRMFNCLGNVLFTNISIEQIHSFTNPTFLIYPKQDGTIFLQWNFTNKKNIHYYKIYRDNGILSKLNYTIHLLITIPTMFSYGNNIYESMFTDHFIELNTIYTYQVIGYDLNQIILDKTILKIGEVDSKREYNNITLFIAFPRSNGIHLSWKLKSTSLAKFILIYNGINSISNINNKQLIGNYSTDNIKTIISLSYQGPFLLVSDDKNDIASVQLANLTRPRISLTSTHLEFIRKKINETKHAKDIFNQLIKSIHFYKPNNTFSYCWPARDAALLYAITNNITFINFTLNLLNINKINYTIYDNSAIKLRFSFSTMARVQAFDWAYRGFHSEQRKLLIQDFQYAASIFSSYSDDHSKNINDKASNWIGIVKSSELIQHLTLYGEQDYPNDQAERRILFLLNEIQLHLQHSYSSSGYMQEGLNYLSYTISILAPAIYLTKSMGISIFDQLWSHPDWHNLALHIISLRKQRNSLQFGVSDSIYSYNGFLPYIFNSTNHKNIKSALKWLYDRTMGINSSSPVYDGKDKCAALLFYPYEIQPQNPSITFPQSNSMIIDNIEGFYVFRNRYQDKNDVLIALMNRNRRHSGWNANETFALSIMSHDTTWAQMPGKQFKYSNQTNKFSTPLIDGWPREPPKQFKLGFTKQVKSFSNQGGGYVFIDSTINFNISLAQRQFVVDMIKRDNIDTIIVINDDFIDIRSHTWYWQLSPKSSDISQIILTNQNNLSTFIIKGKNQSWLKGWIYNDQNTTLNNSEQILRIFKYGFNAKFKIVMALGMGKEPDAFRITNGIQINNISINFNNLSHGLQETTTSIMTTIPPDINKTSIIILIIIMTSTFVCLFILIFIGILLRKIIKRNNQIYSTTKIETIVRLIDLFI